MSQPNEQVSLENTTDLLSSSSSQRLHKFYVAAICIFITAIPVVIAAGVWVWMSVHDSRREMSNYLVVRAVQVKHTIDTWIKEEYEVLEALGSTLHVAQHDLDTLQTTLQTAKGRVVRWKAAFVYDAQTGILIADTLGSKAQTPIAPIQDAIRRVSGNGEPTVWTNFADGNKDDPTYGIYMFVPILENGAVRYVLSVVVQYDIFQRMMVTAAAPFYDIGIINREDRMIARTNRDESFRGELTTEDFRLNAKGEDRPEGTFIGRTYNYKQTTAAFSRSALTGWTIIAASGLNSADALTLQTQWAFFAISGLSLILVAVLAIMILYNMMLRRVGNERMLASRAFSDLQTRLLTTTNQALQEQSKAASEREVLLREIYHRVKNNLQIIQSLMRLGSRDLKPEQQEPFEAAVRRIGAMARVHTLLYNSPDLASIDFKEYLSSIVAEISESFGAAARGIGARLEVQSIPVALDAAIPLAFIAVELLANAFKHAFPEGHAGQVTITARAEGKNGILIISDNGIGMPEQKGKRRSLGLNLVTRLVEQINGTLVTPQPGRSEYRITFPLGDWKPHSVE